LNDDQGQATKVVKERVAVIKKRVLDKGLVWDETPPSETPPSETPSAMK
jgi:hypothetical protein